MDQNDIKRPSATIPQLIVLGLFVALLVTTFFMKLGDATQMYWWAGMDTHADILVNGLLSARDRPIEQFTLPAIPVYYLAGLILQAMDFSFTEPGHVATFFKITSWVLLVFYLIAIFSVWRVIKDRTSVIGLVGALSLLLIMPFPWTYLVIYCENPVAFVVGIGFLFFLWKALDQISRDPKQLHVFSWPLVATAVSCGLILAIKTIYGAFFLGAVVAFAWIFLKESSERSFSAKTRQSIWPKVYLGLWVLISAFLIFKGLDVWLKGAANIQRKLVTLGLGLGVSGLMTAFSFWMIKTIRSSQSVSRWQQLILVLSAFCTLSGLSYIVSLLPAIHQFENIMRFIFELIEESVLGTGTYHSPGQRSVVTHFMNLLGMAPVLTICLVSLLILNVIAIIKNYHRPLMIGILAMVLPMAYFAFSAQSFSAPSGAYGTLFRYMAPVGMALALVGVFWLTHSSHRLLQTGLSTLALVAMLSSWSKDLVGFFEYKQDGRLIYEVSQQLQAETIKRLGPDAKVVLEVGHPSSFLGFGNKSYARDEFRGELEKAFPNARLWKDFANQNRARELDWVDLYVMKKTEIMPEWENILRERGQIQRLNLSFSHPALTEVEQEIWVWTPKATDSARISKK